VLIGRLIGKWLGKVIHLGLGVLNFQKFHSINPHWRQNGEP
jgi:hypothetical protein